MKKHFIPAAIITIGLLAGCGGSGTTGSDTNSNTSNNTNSTTSVSKTVVSGMVADGYLVGATVFLDKNKNYMLDDGEPSATTDATGAYTLTIDAADIGKYPIVALAIKDSTVDLDTNTPVTSTYVLSMHGVSVTPSPSGTVTGTVSNFISPISTQIREMIESGKYATVQAAAEALRAQAGLPASANMTGDYVRNKDGDLHTAAQNMAAAMGAQAGQVMPGGKVDVKGYRGMVGGIFQNMSAVKKGNFPPKDISQSINDARLMPIQHQFSSMFRPKRGGMIPGSSVVPSSATTCTGCHAIPPVTGKHAKHISRNITCGVCHGSGYSSTTVNTGTHNNGTKNLSSNIGWNATTRSCSNSCHGNNVW